MELATKTKFEMDVFVALLTRALERQEINLAAADPAKAREKIKELKQQAERAVAAYDGY